MKKHFRKIAKIALVMIYLVIIAGAVVRMTGSGMGCPDWPKCFGYYIPPTEIEQLEFQPNHDYKKGVVIIKNESLLVVKEDFFSRDTLDISNWNPYTKHDYATFNPVHTWVEYINRLLGALSGIPILIFTVLSFWFWKDNKWITIVSVLTVFAMAFQAWLGKTVVDSNLAPFKITVHMVMALVIVAMILFLIFKTKRSYKHQIEDNTFKTFIVSAIVLSLIQIVLGTQVRQEIDTTIKSVGYIKSMWMENPSVTFYIHRSFSILILIVNLALFVRNRKLKLGYKKVDLLFSFILLEIATGIAMFYFDFPFLSQPIHLVIATILFGIQFYVYLESKYSRTIATNRQ